MKAKEHQDTVKLICNRYEQQLADLREQLRAANANANDNAQAATEWEALSEETSECHRCDRRYYGDHCPYH